MSTIIAEVFRTSFGWCAVAAASRKIIRVVLPCHTRSQAVRELKRTPAARPFSLFTPKSDVLLKRAVAAVTRYFEGMTDTGRVALDLSQGTAFQQAVWRAAQRIPRGEVLTYRKLAELIGRPRAARAVGNALAANPVPVLVPCHRVVASDGTLGGFQGSESTRLKLKMLELEGLTRESLRGFA